MNNNEILKALQRGDESAFEYLFELHCQNLFRYAAIITNNTEDAREIVNETFFRVFLNSSSVRDYSSFTSWLFRITKNLCMDYLSKRRKNLHILETISKDCKISGEAESPVNAGNLQESLSVLSQNQKDIIILKDISGYSYAEISSILKKSITSLKTAHSRALKKLACIPEHNERKAD
ncbi:MAG: RNA polymerase sigma factor [Firmicutes bacterium]|nr:RNA polymerase sigma factor [Bacillota bacterium]